MAKARPIQIEFPLGGQNRRAGYAQKFRPFTTPRAINVRGVGSLEKRGRGGCRPGLAKFVDNDFGTNITGIQSVTYVDASGDRQQDLAVIADGTMNIVQGGSVTPTIAYLSINGDNLTISGDNLIFGSTVSSTNPLADGNSFDLAEWGGKLYIADSTLKEYDPVTGNVNTVDDAPSGQPLVEIYQQRVVLAGGDHVYYISGQADATDWDAGADYENVGRAVFGQLSDQGIIGEKVLALHNYHDRALIFGCRDSIWALYGNPAGPEARKVNVVSPYVGILSRDSYTVTPNGTVIFLSRRGVYTWQIGSEAEPAPFSERLIPEELLAIDTTTTDVLMEYDHRSRGVHLFLTPQGINEEGTHWWIDLDNNAFWEVSLPYDMQPLVSSRVTTDGYSDVVFGCRDGYIRRFDDSATTDDGTAIQSDIIIGPFHVSGQEGMDGQIVQMVGALAKGSGNVDWKIVVADSAEEVVDKAEEILEADGLTGVDKIGRWTEGQNTREYPRSRGPWAIIWLSSTEQWSYEAITMYNAQLGRLR